MTIKPLGDRVVVKRLPLPDKTEGGLLMLGREYPTIGTVLAIGRGKYRPRSGTFQFQLPEINQNLLQIGHKVQFSREAIRRGQDLGNDIVILDADQCLLGIEG